MAEAAVDVGSELDAAAVARLDEARQHVVGQRGMADADLRVVVGRAEIAASGEDDILDAGRREAVGNGFKIKAFADIKCLRYSPS